MSRDDIIAFIKNGQNYFKRNDVGGFFKSISRVYRAEIAEFLLTQTSVDILKYMTEIPDGFLEESTKVKSITIPENIKYIGAGAFANSEIEQVTMASGVQTLGNMCFSNCKHLVTVDLSDTIKNIPIRCFENCTELKKVFLSDAVQNIGSDAFSGCDDVEIIANFRSKDKIRAKRSDYEFLKQHLKFTHND